MVPLEVISTKVMMAISSSGMWWPAISSENTSLALGQGVVVDIRAVM